MKIVNYYRGLPTDTALVCLHSALRELGHDVTPCFPLGGGVAKGEASPGVAERLRNRVPAALWNAGQVWSDRRAARVLRAACEEVRPDLLHERYLPLSPGGARVARQLDLPLITIVHEFQAHQMPEKFSPAFRASWRAAGRKKPSGPRTA